MSGLNVARLPGIGEIEDPEPRHYFLAIQCMKVRPPFHVSAFKNSLLDRFQRTARRLEWTPKRLRERQERGWA